MTEEEAWILVKDKISNYHAEGCFEQLPEILKGLVGSPNQLREWALMDIGQLNTVVKSNFIRSYKEKARVEREKLVTPQVVLQILESEQKQIEGVR